MPESVWATQSGKADDASVHIEPEAPLDVQAQKHLVGALGLLPHSAVDLLGRDDAERRARGRLHLVDTRAVEASERARIADAVGGRDLRSVQSGAVPDALFAQGTSRSRQRFGQRAIWGQVRLGQLR